MIITKSTRATSIYDRKIVFKDFATTQKKLELINFLLKICPEVTVEVTGWTTVLQDTYETS